MSWHYLQGQEEASWEGTCLDGAPSALLSLMPTPGASCSPVNATDGCLDFPSGTTSKPSTDAHGEAPLTSFQGDSRAKTFPAPEKGLESKEAEAGCGGTWRELSARYDPVSCGWRTHRCLFDEALPWSSVTLPRWGMMRDGVLWERTTPGLLTSGTGFGSLQSVPTPTAGDSKSTRNSTAVRYKIPPTGIHAGTTLTDYITMWPTPNASDNRPRATQASTDRRRAIGKQISLEAEVKWPTPKSRDWKGQSQRGIHGPMDALPNIDSGDGTPIGGQLNPPWVEWLMGWPIGWTDCDASATDKSHKPWPWRGTSSPGTVWLEVKAIVPASANRSEGSP